MGEAKRRAAMSRDEFHKLMDDITKKLTDERKVIAAGFVGFSKAAIPDDAPDIQRREMCIAFFAGADHLFCSMMSILDPGTEPTDADLARMDAIHQELERFRGLFAASNMTTKGEA